MYDRKLGANGVNGLRNQVGSCTENAANYAGEAFIIDMNFYSAENLML